MSTPEIILAVVTLVVGSGGIGSAITIIINRRKVVSDSRSTDIHTDIDQFKAITEKLKVMADDADARAERARQACMPRPFAPPGPPGLPHRCAETARASRQR